MADGIEFATGGIIPNHEGAHEDDVQIVFDNGYLISAVMARRCGLAALDRLNRSEDPPDG